MNSLAPPRVPDRRARPAPVGWAVPTGLIALSLVPVAAGSVRLLQLAGGPEAMPPDHRFDGAPVALVAHIISATLYALAGAFQFVPTIRRNRPAWHRRSGRLLIAAGLVVAGSAMWLTLAYPPQPGTGPVLFAVRLLVAPCMAAALVLGLLAIRRRDIARHRAWMIRAYALGLGAGTQVLTEGIGSALFGTGETRGDLAKAAAWVVNLAVAEWLIRRRPRHRTTPQRRRPRQRAATS